METQILALNKIFSPDFITLKVFTCSIPPRTELWTIGPNCYFQSESRQLTGFYFCKYEKPDSDRWTDEWSCWFLVVPLYLFII